MEIIAQRIVNGSIRKASKEQENYALGDVSRRKNVSGRGCRKSGIAV